MSEFILNTRTLPEPLYQLIRTEQVTVKEVDGVIHLMPLKEKFDSTFGLCGMFKGSQEMTVDKFLERKRMDKELEL